MYLEIQWKNIEKGQSHNFDKYPRTYAYPKYLYDMSSIMQYTLDGFGVGGRPSMILTVRCDLLNTILCKVIELIFFVTVQELYTR